MDKNDETNLPTVQMIDENDKKRNISYEPQEVTFKTAMADVGYTTDGDEIGFVHSVSLFRRLLIEEELIGKSVCIWTSFCVFPAIPVGKFRKSGTFDMHGNNDFNRIVMEILKDRDGFPNLRIDHIGHHGEVTEICWGEGIPWGTSDEKLGRSFGYKNDVLFNDHYGKVEACEDEH